MSVRTEIDRIVQNIARTYAALSEMGATMPSVQNSENLAATVRTISAGDGEYENAISVTNNTDNMIICGAARMHPGEQVTMPLPEDGAEYITFTLVQSPSVEGITVKISGPCYDWYEDAYTEIDTEVELIADGSQMNPTFVWNGSGVYLLHGATVEVNIA